MIHLHRSEDEPEAAARHAVIKGPLTGAPHASLCAAYPMPDGNTAGLLTPEFQAMLEDARKQFKYVLIDCPPMQSNPAALLLAPESDASIVTVPAGSARQSQVQSACTDLRRCGAKLMGFVLIPG
jgi:hypothetical protein